MEVPRWLGPPTEAQIEGALSQLRSSMSDFFELSDEEATHLMDCIDTTILEFLQARAECHSDAD